MKHPRSRTPRSLAFLAALSCAGGLHAATVIVDDFDYASFTNDQTYWSRVASSGDQAFISPVGTAVLRGRMTQTEHTTNSAAPAYSVIVSSSTDNRYDFFSNRYTVSADNISLTAANLDLNQAYFRIGLSSTATRQFSADDAITMRFRYNNDGLGGLMLFGYKMNQASVDGEVRTGASTTSASLNSINFTGTLQSAAFTLETVSFEGTVASVAYTVSFTTTAQTYSATGTMLVDQAQWGDGSGFAALALEARRNGNTGYNLTGNSDAQVTIDTVSYTDLASIPEPASFAALAGLGMLGLAATRRRRQA